MYIKSQLNNIYQQLLSSNIPCLIFCRDLEPEQSLIDIAYQYGVPILISKSSTSSFMAEVIRWLKVQLACRNDQKTLSTAVLDG